MIDTFTREQFESALTDAQLKFDDLGWIQGERSYYVALDGQSGIRIRSSIHHDGQSAQVGQDSIRCWLVGPGAKSLIGKETLDEERWTTRQPGWEKRLVEKIDQLRFVRSKLGNCSKCGSPNLIARSHSQKNPGRIYVACSNFSCKGWSRWVSHLDEFEQGVMPLNGSRKSEPPSNEKEEKDLFDPLSGKSEQGHVSTARQPSAEMIAELGQPEDVGQNPAAPTSSLSFLSNAAPIEMPKESPAEPVAKPFTPSPYQEAIRDFVLNQTQALRVEAYAGSGKTSTNAFVCRAIDKSRGNVKMMVFSKANQLDMQAKIPDWIPATTTHSAGFSDIRKVYRNVKVDERKTLNLFKSAFEHDYELREQYPAVTKLVSLCKNTLSEPTNENLDELCERYDVNLNGSRDEVFDAVSLMLKQSAEQTNVVDFDDMLWFPASGKVGVGKCDLLFVDEYQDNNRAQEAYYLKTGARIVFVGDEHQCHPGDTMIAMTGGTQKRIDEIKTGDSVVSYYTQKSIFKGRRTQGRKVEQVSRRLYDGDLIVISARKEKVKVTPEHRCLVRMKPGTSYIMYLMMRENQARIGITKTSHLAGSGLAMRARQEKADRAWILAMYDTLEQARVAELVTQARFGLPSLIFRSTEQAGNMQQEFIDRVYFKIGGNLSKAVECLDYFGRHYQFPIWRNSVANCHFGTKSFVTQACNLISHYMTVRTFEDSDRGGEWEVISVSKEQYHGIVWSLAVEPTEGGRRLYVANNIVVHNSIYGFRGAMIGAMDRMQSKLQAEQLPLPISYRCAKSVIALAQTIVPQIQARPDAPDGLVEDCSGLSLVKAGDMVLCRNNAPLVKPCFELIRNGVKATIKGRDIGTNLVNLIRKVEKRNPSYSFLQLLANVQDYVDEQSAKLTAQHKESQAASLQDQGETIVALSEACHSLADLENRVKTIFSDDVQGVIFSTIHKIKGGEADRVFIIKPELLGPQKYDTKSWQLEQLQNLNYVAITRARLELRFVR